MILLPIATNRNLLVIIIQKNYNKTIKAILMFHERIFIGQLGKPCLIDEYLLTTRYDFCAH